MGTTDCPPKKLQSDFQHQYLSKLLIDLKILWDYKTITNHMHLSENPTQFGSVVTKNKDFCKACQKSLPSKFDRKETRNTTNTSLHFFWMVYVDVWKGPMTYLTKSIFLCDFLTKLDGVFAKLQIISYVFIFLKHIQVNFKFLVIDSESLIVIFFFDNR